MFVCTLSMLTLWVLLNLAHAISRLPPPTMNPYEFERELSAMRCWGWAVLLCVLVIGTILASRWHIPVE